MGTAIKDIPTSRAGKIAFLLVFFAGIFLPVVFSQAPAPAAAEKPDLQMILDKMAEHKKQRDKEIQSFGVDRVFRVENKRFRKEGTLQARMIYVAPEEKLFAVQSFKGSGIVRTRVLNRMIEEERAGAHSDIAAKTAILPSNYQFEYLRQEIVKGRQQYVLRAIPRVKYRLLFDGKIWVDSEDFAVTRIEARPAVNPSWWISKAEFIHEYERMDRFWFPVRNSSISSGFFLGKTTTEMLYTNYQINTPGLAEEADEIRKRGEKLEIQLDAKDAKRD